MMSNAGLALPPRDVTFSHEGVGASTLTMTPMTGCIPGECSGHARSKRPPMSRPPTCTPWPMPGISKYVQPSILPKNARASAGCGVSMLIQQNSPVLRVPIAIVPPRFETALATD